MFNQQPLYGNPYPMRYQQPVPAQNYYPQMAPIPQQNTQEGLIRVTGVEGARAYPVPPNSVVPLFDADRDVLYVKSTDAGGFATIRAFTFAPMQEAPQNPGQDYVTRAEFNELKEMIANGKQLIRTSEQPAVKSASEE